MLSSHYPSRCVSRTSKPRRPLRHGIIAIATCLLTLTACSSVNFAYNSAPGLIANEFNDAFNLTRAQNDQLESALEQFFAWHRREELPRYQRLLADAAQVATDGLSSAEFAHILREVRAAWHRAAGQLIQRIGHLATTLTPAQIEHFRHYDARQRDDYYSEYLELNSEERRTYRAEQGLERLERWYGSFDRKLESRIIERLQALPDTWDIWQQYRTIRTETMLRTIATSTDPETATEALRSLLLNPDHPATRDLEPARAAYWQAYGEMLEEINAWVSPEQRQQAVEQLQKYAQMVAEIDPQN